MVQRTMGRTRRTSHDPDEWVAVGHPTDGWSKANCVTGQADFRPRSQFANELRGIGHPVVSFREFGLDNESASLRQRLENANAHFRRKAAQVLDDEDALKLLDGLYQDVVADIPDTEISKAGVCLAKLTAANFCEVGANVIYITHTGRRFVESVKRT